MSTENRFDTPGGVRDIPSDYPEDVQERWLETWHQLINDEMGEEPTMGAAAPEPAPDDVSVGEFYNRRVTKVNPVGERRLVWMGFPRKLLVPHRDERQEAFALADARGVDDRNKQDEYLEWHVTRDKATKKIKKVTFVTETPEYWEKLFEFDPRRCAEVYSELVGAKVSPEELTSDGVNYDRVNKWNTTDGIVHYIVNDLENSLPVAIRLAKGSVGSLPGRHVRDNYEGSSSALTSADPRVQIDIDTLARKGLSVTCLEPIGVYMGGWDDTGWTKKDGSPVGNYWRVVRGRPGAALRLEYEVPEAEGFTVSDIKIGGRPIEYGGQLAEHITVMFGGLAGTRPA
jgi:hypothetical protein